MKYRILSPRGRGAFGAALVPDLTLAAWALTGEPSLSTAIGSGELLIVAFAAFWGLRMLWWAHSFVVAAKTSSIGGYFLLSALSTITFALQTAWTPALPGAIAAYAVFPLSLLFYLLYPTDWAEAQPSQAAARRATRTEADFRAASLFADGVGAATEPHYRNPMLEAGAEHAGDRYWVQEYGNPEHPVLIMLPGMPVSPVSLASVISGFLLKSYFVVLIEYPGTGHGRGERFTLAELRRRVALYLEELQPNAGRPALLYGVSGGGNAVLYLAAELPSLVDAVTAVVAVAPGNTTFSFRAERSVFWHPLTLKTKGDARVTPVSAVRKIVNAQLEAIAEQLPMTDGAWHDNLEVSGEMDVDPSEDASADDYFHHAGLLQRHWFSQSGPGVSPDYKGTMAMVRDRLRAWMSTPGTFEAMYAPEIYPEYVEAYVRADMDGLLGQVRCPVLFVGGAGDAASKQYESWSTHLPEGLAHEVIMARVVAAGLGGYHAHAHAGTYWRRHVLAVDRFFRQHVPAVERASGRKGQTG